MTALTEPASATTTPDIGVVGNRHLVALQTFEISRLTTHPVPLVPGSFIAVTGMGPKGDSNGSGKTSFLAAISLLLGDAQWRLEANGSQDAPKLLFHPDSAGLPAQLGYRQADYGYVVGVFAAEDAEEDTAITVWLRISATPQYLKARWTPGVHVAIAASDTDREAQADVLWNALPKDNEVGPKTLRSVLYGNAAKGIAYVDTPMRKSAPSLLSQELTRMTPEQIGTALIELTGRQGLLETEEEQRALLATQEAELRDQQDADARARIEEDIQLDAVGNRDRSRARLAEGETFWRLHFASGYLDVLAEDERLRTIVEDLTGQVAEKKVRAAAARATLAELKARTDLAQAERAAQQAAQTASDRLIEAQGNQRDIDGDIGRWTGEKTQLLPTARSGSGASVDQTQERVRQTREAYTQAQWTTRQANEAHELAQKELAQAQAGAGGEAGRTLAALCTAGIDARLLLDEVTLTEEARTFWEPVLWTHRSAVVVSPTDMDAALSAVTGHPGAVLVTADATLTEPAAGLPDGVAAGVPVAGLLAGLADRYRYGTDPDRAVDTGLGEHTVGGFTEQIAGRAARVAAAQARVDETGRALEQARSSEHAAQARAEIAAEDLAAAQATVRVAEIDQRLTELHNRRNALVEALSGLQRLHNEAQEAYVTARANAKSYHEQVQLAEAQVRTAEQEATKVDLELREKGQERNKLRVSYWATGWGDTREAARALLDAQPPGQSRHRRSLQNRAAEALKDALDAYCANLTGPKPAALEEAIQRRQRLADTDQPGFGRDTVSFESVAAPLRDLLDATNDSDQILEARIRRHQQERATRIAEVETETDKKRHEWDHVQDMVSARIETALRKISQRLDELVRSSGGHGAELKITETRPGSSTGTWRWEVTPRWKRSSAGHLVDYRKNANGAQVKVFAIKLVLAALLADDGAKGRVLVIDELGNSLGDVNRQDVLRDIAAVAKDQNVTILGTCQDSVMADAAGVCGEILWFSHANESDAYNQPTRMWDFDENRNRVVLTKDWLTAGRTLV